jgi:hypothetical protein
MPVVVVVVVVVVAVVVMVVVVVVVVVVAMVVVAMVVVVSCVGDSGGGGGDGGGGGGGGVCMCVHRLCLVVNSDSSSRVVAVSTRRVHSNSVHLVAAHGEWACSSVGRTILNAVRSTGWRDPEVVAVGRLSIDRSSLWRWCVPMMAV